MDDTCTIHMLSIVHTDAYISRRRELPMLMTITETPSLRHRFAETTIRARQPCTTCTEGYHIVDKESILSK